MLSEQISAKTFSQIPVRILCDTRKLRKAEAAAGPQKGA